MGSQRNREQKPKAARATTAPRLLIVDDHAVIRRGLVEILKDGFPTAVFGEARDVRGMMDQVSCGTWDIVILDITMPGRSGLDALIDIKKAASKTAVLILSMHDENQYAVRALKAGASGYVTKDHAPEELVIAVGRVLDGRKYVSASLAEKFANDVGAPAGQLPHEKLSEREFQVLCLLAKGSTIKEIGAVLRLSVKTVSTYHVRLLQKMSMNRDAELVRYAVDHQLLT